MYLLVLGLSLVMAVAFFVGLMYSMLLGEKYLCESEFDGFFLGGFLFIGFLGVLLMVVGMLVY